MAMLITTSLLVTTPLQTGGVFIIDVIALVCAPTGEGEIIIGIYQALTLLLPQGIVGLWAMYIIFILLEIFGCMSFTFTDRHHSGWSGHCFVTKLCLCCRWLLFFTIAKANRLRVSAIHWVLTCTTFVCKLEIDWRCE